MSGGVRPPLVLTLGEPAGIGPDIAIAAWQKRNELPPFLFAGDPDLIVRRARLLGVDIRTEQVDARNAADVFPRALPCLQTAEPVRGTPGETSTDDAHAVIASIRAAVELVNRGEASAIVTNPIHKKALNDVGFPFPGHTEFLGALAAELFGGSPSPIMMLAGPDLRVVPVTVHIPLASVPAMLTTELIVRTGKIVAEDMKTRFRVERPRLAIAGLNPHAGEDGMLGLEDGKVVAPAVEALREAGIDAFGPLPADTMFHATAREIYDAALCMYHDQALIPIKALAFDDAVNVTLGLPFFRTSPDHGTALSLAGTGKARPTSLIAAIRMADELSKRGPTN